MFHKIRLLLLYTLLLSGVTASADYARYLAELPQKEAESVRYEIEKLSVAGLDTSPVISKVREGLAKNVPAEKITQAVRQEVSMRIRSGRMAADAGLKPNEQLVNSLALAMRRGAQEKDLASVLRRRGDITEITRTIDRVGIMAQKGVTGEKALELVLQEKSSAVPLADMQDITQKNLLYQQNIQRSQATRLPVDRANDGGTGGHNPKVDHGLQDIQIR